MPPQHAHETPEGIVVQMALYKAAVEKIYPDKAVSASILWTARAALMELPETILTNAIARLALP